MAPPKEAQKEALNASLAAIAKEIDDRYMRVMEKMDEAGTWTDEVNERFDRMYANFHSHWGKYLKEA